MLLEKQKPTIASSMLIFFNTIYYEPITLNKIKILTTGHFEV